MSGLPRKTNLEDFDLKTSENEKHFCKLIIFKRKREDVRWHICMPEMTTIKGFVAFCGLVSWSEIDTSNLQRLFSMMDRERSSFCERCAEELFIARHELYRQGYIPNLIL